MMSSPVVRMSEDGYEVVNGTELTRGKEGDEKSSRFDDGCPHADLGSMQEGREFYGVGVAKDVVGSPRNVEVMSKVFSSVNPDGLGKGGGPTNSDVGFHFNFLMGS
ncbi:hypothetical protein Hanom_Chr04g00345811 [Helianthus anomalus]